MEVSFETISASTLSISQCVTLKLNEKNYLLWKLQFEQLPFTMSVTNGDQVTIVSNPEYAKWMRSDQLVMAWLCGFLSEETLRFEYGLNSAQEVWSALS